MSKKLIYLASFVLVLGLVPTSIANAAEPGLVGCWRLDEGSGTTVSDSSGYGNHGTFGPQPYDPQWVPGMVGYALEFDGDDYVDVGNSSMLNFGTDNWNVTGWIKTVGEGTLFGNGADHSGGIRYQLRVRNGHAVLTLDDDITKVEEEGGTSVADDVWHHLAAFRDGTTALVYVDGMLDITLTLPDGYDLSGTTQYNAYIGAVTDNRDPTGNTLEKLYTGLIDDVRVYNHALSEAEIEVVMTGEPPMAPAKASTPSPRDGKEDVPRDVVLSWRPGKFAPATNGHKVYFSEDFKDVNDGVGGAIQDVGSYTPPAILEFAKTYYWRVDEVNGPPDYTIYQGDVWSFTVIDHILVDNFENYNDYGPHRIFDVWIDGWGVTANGSTAGYPESPFAETNIVHGGGQSMPYFYNNDAFAKYSEASMTLTSQRDWTAQGVKALSLWFRGHPAYMGGFVEGPTGTYTMTAEGADIWGNSDQFHFAFKQISGAGSIIAKVESVEDTHEWAKAGVMIRDTLEPDSSHAMMAVTPGNGVWFGRRTETGDSSSDSEAGITAPQWVKIERTIGGLVRAFYSADGNTWTQLGAPEPVTMNTPVYIGLALTSHNSGVACEAKFSNVSFPNTTVGPQWTNQDIGLLSNEAQPMYVTAEDGSGTTAAVYHDDPNASLIDTWTEFNIDLKDFSDQGVNLNDIGKLSIGFGDKDNPQPGAGLVFFDDIRLYPPRYVPDKITPLAADFTDDGVVDIKDLEIMSNDWLQGDYTIYATTPSAAIALWAFDNNANDSEGSNNGIPHGNQSYVDGKFDQAISLDGDDYVDCGNPAELDFATGDWSICAWINTTQSDDTFTIFANGGDNSGGICYTLGIGEEGLDGVVTLTTDDDTTKVQAISSTLVNDDQWHHVVGLRAGNTTQVYVDGVLDGTNTLPVGYDLSGTSQHNAYVGAITDNSDATGNTLEKFFVGTLDDVRIYNYALSPAEILGAMGQNELYVPLTSPANIYDEEPINSKKVNFKDFAILADEWLEQPVWPKW